MIISLFTKEKLYTASLPEKISGKYWVSDRDSNGCLRNVADIEASGAFQGCTSLTSVTIPDSVTQIIGDYAFWNCPNLTVYCGVGSVTEKYCQDNNIPYVAS